MGRNSEEPFCEADVSSWFCRAHCWRYHGITSVAGVEYVDWA